MNDPNLSLSENLRHYADMESRGLGHVVSMPEVLRRAADELDHAHSEQFVLMFLGYLCAKVHGLGAGDMIGIRLLWDNFKREMGK